MTQVWKSYLFYSISIVQFKNEDAFRFRTRNLGNVEWSGVEGIVGTAYFVQRFIMISREAFSFPNIFTF